MDFGQCPCCTRPADQLPEELPEEGSRSFLHRSHTSAGPAPTKSQDAYLVDSKRNIIARGMKRFEEKKEPPSQPDYEIIASNIASVLGQNPTDFTLNGTNCYILGTGEKRILIDTAESDYGQDKFLVGLRECMAQIGCTGFDLIIVTHLHSDHFGGVARLQEIYGPNIPVAMCNKNIYSEIYTMKELQRRGLIPYLEKGPDFHRGMSDKAFERKCLLECPTWPDEDLSWDKFHRTKAEIQRSYFFLKRAEKFKHQLVHGNWPFVEIEDGMVLRSQGATLTALYTPGHSLDHMSFYMEEGGDIFSGDHVLGYGTTFFQDLYDYMASLRKILAMKPGRLFPGHGPCIPNGFDYVSRYVEHRDSRERQVVETLEGMHHPKTAMEITKVLYLDTSRQRLMQAAQNISKILTKLCKEGKCRAFRQKPLLKQGIVASTPNEYIPDDHLLKKFSSYDIGPSFRYGNDVFFALRKAGSL